MKKVLKLLFSRMVIVGALLLVQVAILIVAIWRLNEYFTFFYAISVLLSLVVTLWVINKDDNPSYKLAWVVPILLFPLFGGAFYLLFGRRHSPKRLSRYMEQTVERTLPYLEQEEQVMEHLEQADLHIAKQSRYIFDHSHFPVYENTYTEYLSPGEVKFERLVQELEKAEHFIFLEYFIIQEGIMWNTVLEILERKVKQGVDVRVIYDDIGCLTTLPHNYHQILESKGISCMVFNPFRPVLSAIMNNRDHRKILVIDGHTAFTGGINLADEYINAYEKHGHWKDASILLKGEAVRSLTLAFLQMWDYKNPSHEDLEPYLPYVHHPASFVSDGFVQPYSDSPLDRETVGEMVYLNLINNAKRYIYINTPYLIIDNELVTAISLAAKSGVDVRIVTPHVADKWYVHLVTQAFYPQLLAAGVKIYEYTPGFIHSKTFVVDDEVGTVGTINLDYRSLYLHFECGVWMYQTHALLQLKQDFLKTLEICTPMTLEHCRKFHLAKRLMQAVLRLISPLM